MLFFLSQPGRWRPRVAWWVAIAFGLALMTAPVFVEVNHYHVAVEMASGSEAPIGAMADDYIPAAEMQVAKDLRRAAAVWWVGLGMVAGSIAAAWWSHSTWTMRELQSTIATAALGPIPVRPVK